MEQSPANMPDEQKLNVVCNSKTHQLIEMAGQIKSSAFLCSDQTVHQNCILESVNNSDHTNLLHITTLPPFHYCYYYYRRLSWHT